MTVHLERHLPIVVVGNNLSSLILSLTYNAPYIFVQNEFPLFGKGKLTVFETAKIHRILFGGFLTTIIRAWNKFCFKVAYWDWSTLLSGVGGLDITAGKCKEIRFSDPNSIFLVFENDSTMRIYYDLCFLTTHEKINLDWEGHEKFNKNAKVPVYDFWFSPRIAEEQSKEFSYTIIKYTEPKEDPLVRKIYFPFYKRTWKKFLSMSLMTKEELEEHKYIPATVKKEVRKVLVDHGVVRTRTVWEDEHLGRLAKHDGVPFFFYPREDFMFDHNKMVVNWTLDKFLEHMEEIVLARPDKMSPYWKKFIWMMKTTKVNRLKDTVEKINEKT